jgi:aspartate/methionine/tyrosine aminotransferase
MQGLPILRNEIRKLYNNINTDQILTFAAAEEGIYCVMQALLRPQDHVIVITPCYQSLKVLPSNITTNVTEISLSPESSWTLDLEDLRSKFTPTTRLLVLNFPHNPTGAVLDKVTLQGIVDIARSHGAYIFSDEVYRYLEQEEHYLMPAIADIYEKGISLSVMSKAYGLAGLRIGWIATQDKEILEKSGHFKYYTSICNSAPSEILALMALRGQEQILKRNHSIMNENLYILDQFLDVYTSLFRWTRPLGGCIAFPQFLGPQSIEDLSRTLVEEQGVLILPGSVFDWPGNNFRIGFGRKNMPEALDRFEKFIRKL